MGALRDSLLTGSLLTALLLALPGEVEADACARAAIVQVKPQSVELEAESGQRFQADFQARIHVDDQGRAAGRLQFVLGDGSRRDLPVVSGEIECR